MCMGYAGDYIGRHEAMCLTLAIATVGVLGSGLLSVGTSDSIYAVISLFRFLLGMGVGGIYPLSATKAAEDAILRQELEELQQ